MSATTGTQLGHVEIDSEELGRLRSRRPGVAVIDVRSPGEYAAVHIPGSVNLPLDHLHRRHREVAERLEGPVVLTCAQGMRSEEAARLLESDGLSDLRILAGGINAWAASGGEVVRGRGRWAMERQVRLVAGSIVLGSTLASLFKPKARWLAAGVGAGLTYSAVSNTCAMARVLALLPYNQGGPSYDFDQALGALSSVGAD